MHNKQKGELYYAGITYILKGGPEQMLTELTLRDSPTLVKFLTGVPADDFWNLMQTIETEYARYEYQRHAREQRQRAVGGGRRCDLPLVIRVTMLLLYLRAHIPQWLVALLFGAHQSDISCDLRRLLPLLSVPSS